ncbi:MAG: phosphocarrier protein HPr [Culicoidibacterales bacterium]
MKEITVKIIDPSGIHARPATVLVNAASRYASDVKLGYNANEVNLKSIMGVMSLAVPSGAEVRIIAEGDDAEQAVEGILTVLREQKLAE